MALAEVKRCSWSWTSTFGLSAFKRFLAETSLEVPTDGVSWSIWRCRFEASTLSKSTRPSRPTPAAVR